MHFIRYCIKAYRTCQKFSSSTSDITSHRSAKSSVEIRLIQVILHINLQKVLLFNNGYFCRSYHSLPVDLKSNLSKYIRIYSLHPLIKLLFMLIINYKQLHQSISTCSGGERWSRKENIHFTNTSLL
jgi:hypothetical protein